MILRRLFAPLLVLVNLSCGSSPPPRASLEMRTLSETRANEIIAEVLTEAGITFSNDWSIGFGQDQPLVADFRLGTGPFGVEWVGEQDRVDFGDALPHPADGGQLRIMPGTGTDASAQILILDHQSYEFANEREHVQRGVPGASETEERLRRDLRDFLEFVRGQGGP